jgi:uncharacterized glyoxalase superfamily protein PhnB
MKIESLTPMLRTWDLRASITFYTEVLGFECQGLSEEQGWASLRRDGVAIMLACPNQQHEGDTAPAFTGSLYFHTDDVDGLWQRLKDRVRVCYPIENFEYGMREFAIYDNNGYLLQFGQPLPATT